MTDEKLEKILRELPSPELPDSWGPEILSNARRESRVSTTSRQVWPALLIYLKNLCLRNPITATAMIALWMTIFFLKVSTPVDPQERQLMAHYDPNKSVYFVSISDEILIAQLEFEQSEQRPLRQMP